MVSVIRLAMAGPVTPILFVMMKERALKKGKLELSKMAGWMKEN